MPKKVKKAPVTVPFPTAPTKEEQVASLIEDIERELQQARDSAFELDYHQREIQCGVEGAEERLAELLKLIG